MKQLKIIVFLFVIPTFIFGQYQKKEQIRLFYLGGQSNMDGYGNNSDLPLTLKHEFQNVWIYHGNPVPQEHKNGGIGIWEKLKPGHGKGFSSDGTKNDLSPKFGIELSFAKRLQSLFPEEKIMLIKYSKGGTSIDSLGSKKSGSWEASYVGETGLNQYDYFLKTVDGAMQAIDIDGNGVPEQLIPSGIIWMQGESDAKNEKVALRYYENLKRLMELIRAAFRVNDLPIVIGKISDSGAKNNGKVWKYAELVQYAQEKFSRTDRNSIIIRDTRDYEYSDPHHYDSQSYIDLGEKFADAIHLLLTSPTK